MLDLWLQQTFNLSLGQSLFLLGLCLMLLVLVMMIDKEDDNVA